MASLPTAMHACVPLTAFGITAFAFSSIGIHQKTYGTEHAAPRPNSMSEFSRCSVHSVRRHSGVVDVRTARRIRSTLAATIRAALRCGERLYAAFFRPCRSNLSFEPAAGSSNYVVVCGARCQQYQRRARPHSLHHASSTMLRRVSDVRKRWHHNPA